MPPRNVLFSLEGHGRSRDSASASDQKATRWQASARAFMGQELFSEAEGGLNEAEGLMDHSFFSQGSRCTVLTKTQSWQKEIKYPEVEGTVMDRSR